MGGNPSPDSRDGPCRACQRCGAGLRRGRVDALCEPCARRPGSSGPLLDTEFFTREPIRRALADYDFGYLFRAVRRATGLTQQQLGDLLDLDQDRISRIERGERRLRDIATIARVASRLGIPPELLGFDPNTATAEEENTGETLEEDEVLRRDFSWVVVGTVLGLSVNALDLKRLAAAELTARQGYASYTLALTTADPKHAARAVPLLQQAVDGRGPAYTRGRALNLAALSGAHTLTGDLDTAARTGHHAVQEITAIASPRAYDRLRTLNTVLQPHTTTPAVNEVRGQIQAAVTAA